MVAFFLNNCTRSRLSDLASNLFVGFWLLRKLKKGSEFSTTFIFKAGLICYRSLKKDSE